MNDTVGNGSEKPDLYAAIGGAPTVEAVVDELYRRLSGDPFVQHHFQPERLATLKAAQRAVLFPSGRATTGAEGNATTGVAGATVFTLGAGR